VHRARQTALAFTQGYLGFRQINKVAAHTISAGDARVIVGLTLANGQVKRSSTVRQQVTVIVGQFVVQCPVGRC
jgi:hypothetical protein